MGGFQVSTEVIDLACPGCGAPVSTSDAVCKYCRRPVVITTFNSVYAMSLPEVNKYAGAYTRALADAPEDQKLNTSAAMCFLKLKMYSKASAAFAKAVEENFDNSEIFFYAAISLLAGKKAFLAMRPTINKIEEYINAALMIEPKGIYYFFWAYIRYDYHARKHLSVSPSWNELFSEAKKAGLSKTDVDQLFAILGVPCPDALA